MDAYADIDGMLWDASSKLARAQIARQISNSSTLRRQQQSRIQKPISTGNSPQNVLWRRQAIQQQRLAPHYSDIYPQMSRRRAITNTPAADVRPYSWHTQPFPSPEPFTYQRHTMYEPAQQAMQAQTPNQYGMYTPSSYVTTPFQSSGYVHVPISSDWATEPSFSPPNEIAPDQSPTAIYHQQTLATTPAMYMAPPPAYSNTTSPSVQPIACSPAAPPQQISSESTPEDEGPELVGMGLYDAPEQSSMLFGGMTGPPQATNGRGLKLEDSWAPPEEDEDQSDDGDGEDEDRESEVQDDDMVVEPDDSAEPHVYGLGNMLPASDMSNKTFFFDDADAMVGATALAGLTMVDWHATPQAWAR